jgi:hypothetical protein
LFFIAALACGSAAHAGRPLQTEDADVLERGACEVEAFTARLSTVPAVSRTRELQLGCGLGLSTQLALATGVESEPGERMRILALSGKTSLLQFPAAAGDSPALTLAYRLDWSKNTGQTWRHASSEVKLVYSAPLSDEFTLHANVGSERDQQARRSSTSWGLAVEHGGCGPVSLMAEVFGDDREASWWNAGLRWAVLQDRWFADISYGRQMASGTPRLVTIGFKLVF